jgi:hypothetical protein
MIDPDVLQAARALRSHLFVGALVLHGQASWAFLYIEGDSRAPTLLVLDFLFALVLLVGVYRLSRILDAPQDAPATTAARAAATAYVFAIVLLPIMDLGVRGLRAALSALTVTLLVSGYFLGRRLIPLFEEWRMPASAEKMRRAVRLYAWLLLLPLSYYHGAWIAWSWVGEEVLPRSGFHLWAGFLAGFVPIAFLARTASTLEREATIADWLEK